MNADDVVKNMVLGKKASIAKAFSASECPPEDIIETIFIHCDIADLTSSKYELQKYIEILSEISKILERNDLKCKVAFRLAENFEDLENRKKALSIYNSCLKTSIESSDKFYEGQALSRLGHFFKRNIQNPPILKKHEKSSKKFENFGLYMANESSVYFQKAADIFREIDHEYNYAVSIFNKSLLMYSEGDLDESYRLALEARIIAENNSFNALLAECILHIANIHCDKKEYCRSQIYYRTSADLFLADGNMQKAADILHKLGWTIALNKNTIKAATGFYEKALSLKKSVDLVQSLGDCFLSKGLVYYSAGSFIKAEGLFANAVSCFDFCRMSGNELISKFFLYKSSLKGSGSFLSKSLCEFMRTYKIKKKKEPKFVSDYNKIIPDSTNFTKAYGLPEDTFAIDRKKLAGLIMDLGTLKWMSGDKVFSNKCACSAAILKNFKA